MDHAFWGLAAGATLPWQRRVESIKQLIDAGFADRLFLSNDWALGDAEREKVNPDGLLYTTRKTIPFLKRIGRLVTEHPCHDRRKSQMLLQS